jgi:branched-chain amino acid transport system permease protein
VSGYLLSGLVVGSQYALFAAGLALLFGTSHVLNFAHGVVFAFGGYATALFAEAGLTNLVLAVFLAAICGGLVGAAALEVVLTPLRSRSGDVVTTALVTVGATIVALAVVDRVFGSDPRGVPVDRSVVTIVAGVPLTNAAILALVSAPILMAGLAVLVQRTGFGLRLRAVAGDGASAEIAGVNAGAVARAAVMMSAVLAAYAGALYAANVANIAPLVGNQLMIKGIALVIVGGMGSVVGAVVVSYSVGILEAMTVGYIGSGWKDLALMVALLLVLAVRPSGLFGHVEVSRL